MKMKANFSFLTVLLTGNETWLVFATVDCPKWLLI